VTSSDARADLGAPATTAPSPGRKTVAAASSAPARTTTKVEAPGAAKAPARVGKKAAKKAAPTSDPAGEPATIGAVHDVDEPGPDDLEPVDLEAVEADIAECHPYVPQNMPATTVAITPEK